MINQSVILNALTDGCEKLGDLCAAQIKSEIERTRLCLSRQFEPDFDVAIGLYRIGKNEEFRFAGQLAPWNWQVSFCKCAETTP